jgi:predicted glutamine amidotransferase
MCRLLGTVVRNPSYLNTVFGDELAEFVALSAEHPDGWGLAYAAGNNQIAVRKSPTRAGAPLGAELVAARSNAAILHLRRASTGMPNTFDNTHPFLAGESMAVAHNGHVLPLGVLDRLCAALDAAPVVGDTDSERFVHLLRTFVPFHTKPEALHRTAQMIDRVAAVESLNCLVLTPEALYAMCCYDESVIRMNGRSDVASYELRYKSEKDRVTVASSGVDQPAPQWRQLHNGEVLEVRRKDLRTTVHSFPPIGSQAAWGPWPVGTRSAS